MRRAEVARQTIDVVLLPESAIERSFVSVDEDGFIALAGPGGRPGPIAIDVDKLLLYKRAVEAQTPETAPARQKPPTRASRRPLPAAEEYPQADIAEQKHRGLANRLARKMGRMAVRKTALVSAAFLFGASTAYTAGNTLVSHVPVLNHLSPSDATYNLNITHDIKSQAIATKEIVVGPPKIAWDIFNH